MNLTEILDTLPYREYDFALDYIRDLDTMTDRDALIDECMRSAYCDDPMHELMIDHHRTTCTALALIIDACMTAMHPDTLTDCLTELFLDNSICPMHRCDYAICFDDDDPECAAIRLIHPSHDT